MAKKYVLNLTPAERAELEAVAKRGRTSVRKVQKARAMLSVSQENHCPAWLDADFAEQITLVCDNLNTYARSSFYKAFPPGEAHRLC